MRSDTRSLSPRLSVWRGTSSFTTFAATSVVLAIACTVRGQEIAAEVVETGDSSIGVVDISMAIGSFDIWTAAGILVQTSNRATLRFAADPDSDTGFALTAPESTDPGAGRFVSFVSLPRGQDQNSRYRTGGAATIPGPLDLDVPDMAASDTLNVSWLEVPPDAANRSGYIARIGLDLPAVPAGGINLDHGLELARVRVLVDISQGANPPAEISFSIFAVPEPASLTLLLLGGLIASRRR